MGSWESASCGARSYKRETTFAADNTVEGRDLVSPCPKGATCVWSGIVEWKGTYTNNGNKLGLSVKVQGGPKGKINLPAELMWDESQSAVVEKSGEATCVYQRSASSG